MGYYYRYRDYYSRGYGDRWRPYVSVDDRRRRAEREAKKLKKAGHVLLPVHVEGRTIARTVWGKAWCDNLKSYSDYDNRLSRGRSYVMNGLVIDLRLDAGEIRGIVSGSETYQVRIRVDAVKPKQWREICQDCAQGIDSMIDLLQGRISKGVMDRLCRQRTGLFPTADEIELGCSCPDGAYMCKHVAAVLYGVGARLDEKPELLFTLRQVDGTDLLASADRGIPLSSQPLAAGKALPDEGLADLFGIEISELPPEPEARAERPRKRAKAARSGKPAAPAAQEAPRAPAAAQPKPQRQDTAKLVADARKLAADARELAARVLEGRSAKNRRG
jgi:uncharacterized Zn finger protein